MTKKTPAVSATAIATWSTLLKKRGTGIFLPATTNIVVSTMVIPFPFSMRGQSLTQRRTWFHLLPARRGKCATV